MSSSPYPDKLGPYRAKRSPDRTPEPVPAAAPVPGTPGDRFVIQEHHARALHWDFRLERDGVLASWAVPKGLPLERGVRRLAVQTEDHPLEYASFEGSIPPGEYGGGQVAVWDRGHYECQKWSDDEVMVTLHGERVEGRYVLVRTRGTQWIVQRLDEASGEREPMPSLIRPMLATPGRLPSHDAAWGFEFKWDGVRTIAYVEGGRTRLVSRNDRDVTVSYPELRRAGEVLGSRDAVLDGEIVAFDSNGRPSFGMLQQRMHVTDAGRARQLADRVPVVLLVFDVLFLEGQSTTERAYRERRGILESLHLDGPHLNAPPWFEGGGRNVYRAAIDQSLEGVVAKRLESTYQPGRRSPDWIKVKRVRTQEVVVGGWTPGQGRRGSTIGALLLGIPGPNGLEYVGRVGTGFTDDVLVELTSVLTTLERPTSPFSTPIPARQAAGARWAEPGLVGEVSFSEWTHEGRLRQPAWRGLRPDKAVSDVQREPWPSPVEGFAGAGPPR